jgi:hypothetical protein
LSRDLPLVARQGMRSRRWLLALTLSSLLACAEDHSRRGREPSSSQEPVAPFPPIVTNEPEPEPTRGAEPPPLEREICSIREFDSLAPDRDIMTTPPCSYRFLSWPLALSPSFLQVQVGERVRSFAAESDGWTVREDGMAITLLGAACDEVLAGTWVRVEFRCQPATAF